MGELASPVFNTDHYIFSVNFQHNLPGVRSADRIKKKPTFLGGEFYLSVNTNDAASVIFTT